MRRARALALLAAAPLCGCTLSSALRVGSKNFTEALILGELYAQTLAAAGIAVARRLNLGATPIAMAALQRGDIDVYPEYTGTALLNVLHLPPQSDAELAYRTVRDAYRERYGLVWLAPSPFDNSNALAGTQRLSARYGLRTLSDVARAAPNLRLGTVPEFLHREDGLPGLQRRYGGFDFKQIVQLDNGVKYDALVRGDVDVVVAFTTDGAIDAEHLVVYEDDRKLFPAYQAAPVLRARTVQADPRIARALDGLAPRLTTVAMRRLNQQVDGPQQREPADVAHDFLRAIRAA